MQDNCLQSDCWSAEIENLSGGMPFTSSAGLPDREMTPNINPMVVRAKGSVGWERRDEGCSSLKASAKQRCPGGAHISLTTGLPLAVPFFPATLYGLELSLPGAVFLVPRLFPASAHRPHVSPCVPSSALQPPRVCRG